MKPAAEFSDKDKGYNEQNPFCGHVKKEANNQYQAQGTKSEKETIDSVLIEFYVTSRNGSCVQEPFCSDGGYPLDHLILLYRRRDSGALGWWMIPEEAVFAPTNKTADRKKAANPAKRDTVALMIVIEMTSFLYDGYIIHSFFRKIQTHCTNGRYCI